ncbi:hypothetical protein K466DRAFT_590454 [Polyporus arcularius HHB13444]|uniref:Protein BIG1 n=1 Tax=Polyporus arcularius HHB13444 TaxID=1314778 RepID=A0A5C3NYT5_9APHY|nr:hypothetical protein K466DRAFT_590454 [Polyporus arcularius HHB13444]
MRFGALPALVVLGASLVAASPIRVVVTEVSYGHAAPEAHDVAHIPTPIFRPIELFPEANGNSKPHRRPFCQSMKDKALDATNALRQMLGLETIKPDIRPIMHPIPAMPRPHHVEMQGGAATGKAALPVLPFVGTPVRPGFAPEGEEGDMGEHPAHRPMWIHRPHHRLHGSFLRRVHHALMSLGPWEGRAVAFVLGCGIGVLLRMVWVMVLVTARAFRGSRDEDAEYEVVFDDAELLVPPPQYTMLEGSEAVPVDEKSEKE